MKCALGLVVALGACGGEATRPPPPKVVTVARGPEKLGPPLTIREVDRLLFSPTGTIWILGDGRLFSGSDLGHLHERTPRGASCEGRESPCELHFGLSGETAWIAAQPAKPDALSLHFSRDSGASWKRVDIADLARPIGLTFVDRKPRLTLVARPELSPSNATDGTVVLVSTDDGDHFRLASRAKETGPVTESKDVLHFSASTPRKDVGVSTHLLRAPIDTGIWSEAQLGTDDVVSFAPRFAADGMRGVLCTDTQDEVRLYRTVDGGLKWSVTLRDKDGGSCDELLPTSRGACMALRGARESGTFLCTRDFGGKWERVRAYEGTDVLAFTDESVLVAWAFARGELLRLPQGGPIERVGPHLAP